jgi:hypothetical protein
MRTSLAFAKSSRVRPVPMVVAGKSYVWSLFAVTTKQTSNIFVHLQFHKVGIVHGDIRDMKIMVKRTGFDDGDFLIINYDSSGQDTSPFM